MNVVGYLRVSTQGQVKDGYSLKYQEDEIKAYCEEQGWNLIYIFRNDEFYITSPDYTKNPFTDKTEDLTLALWVQLEQTHLLKKVNRGGENIRFDDKIIH